MYNYFVLSTEQGSRKWFRVVRSPLGCDAFHGAQYRTLAGTWTAEDTFGRHAGRRHVANRFYASHKTARRAMAIIALGERCAS